MNSVNLGGAPSKCSGLQVLRGTAPILQELGSEQGKPQETVSPQATGSDATEVAVRSRGELGGSEKWCEGQTLKVGAQLCRVLAMRYWQLLDLSEPGSPDYKVLHTLSVLCKCYREE